MDLQPCVHDFESMYYKIIFHLPSYSDFMTYTNTLAYTHDTVCTAMSRSTPGTVYIARYI
jgi:hypothetical protein